MARRHRDAPTQDDGPSLISLDEQRDAARLLRKAFEAGELDEAELRRRLGRVHGAVTPRDLWKATGHRAGSRRRSDWREIRHAVGLQVAILVFAALAMLVVLYGMILYYHGDRSGAHVWPWEWGKSSAPQIRTEMPAHGVLARTALVRLPR
jgi:hypothetical protein